MNIGTNTVVEARGSAEKNSIEAEHSDCNQGIFIWLRDLVFRHTWPILWLYRPEKYKNM